MTAYVCVLLVVAVVALFWTVIELARRRLDEDLDQTDPHPPVQVQTLAVALAHENPPPALTTIRQAWELYEAHKGCGRCAHRVAAEAALTGGGAWISGGPRRRAAS